jgi:hypothetical protein
MMHEAIRERQSNTGKTNELSINNISMLLRKGVISGNLNQNHAIHSNRDRQGSYRVWARNRLGRNFETDLDIWPLWLNWSSDQILQKGD